MVSSEFHRLRVQLIALALACSAAACRYVIDGFDTTSAFALASLAVAISASAGGFSTGTVATLIAVVIARVTLQVDAGTAGLYALEGFAISFLVARLARASTIAERQLAASDARVRELDANERRLRAIEMAFGRLAHVANDYAVVLLDRGGRVLEWPASPVRLFGWRADQVVGQRGSVLFASADADAAFTRLLANATSGSMGDCTGRSQRADGTEFDAEIEIHRSGEQGRDGFAMIVHDLTRDQRWRELAVSATATHSALREEAALAHQQLATLWHLTDPSLNALPASQATTTLLERLRAAVDADGVGLIGTAEFPRRIVVTTENLLAPGVDRRRTDPRAQDDRVLVIQNDPGRVATMSLLSWPATVSSLITVPVLCGAEVEGTIEVAGRSRRSTEWEIALAQVVAARIAGRLQDDSYTDTSAASHQALSARRRHVLARVRRPPGTRPAVR
jgi:PAS domain S-box-containing protein